MPTDVLAVNSIRPECRRKRTSREPVAVSSLPVRANSVRSKAFDFRLREALGRAVVNLRPRPSDVLVRDESGKPSPTAKRELDTIARELQVARTRRDPVAMARLVAARDRLAGKLFPRLTSGIEQSLAEQINRVDPETGVPRVLVMRGRRLLDYLGPLGFRHLLQAITFGVTEPKEVDSPRRLQDEGIYLPLLAANKTPQRFHHHDSDRKPMTLTYVGLPPGEPLQGEASREELLASRSDIQEVPYLLPLEPLQRLWGSGDTATKVEKVKVTSAGIQVPEGMSLKPYAIPLLPASRFFHPQKPVVITAIMRDGPVLHGTLPDETGRRSFTPEERAYRRGSTMALLQRFFPNTAESSVLRGERDFHRAAIAIDNHFCG